MAFKYTENSSLVGKRSDNPRDAGVHGIVSTEIQPTFELFAFTTYTFTNCGAGNSSWGDDGSTRFGPSSAQCQSYYQSQNWYAEYFSVTNGIQSWTIPKDGTYRLEVAGAGGGVPDNASYTQRAGYGAKMTADFDFSAEEVIKFVVGQRGSRFQSGNHSGYLYNAGGGGGSFVMSDTTDVTPHIVAGGGGGASNYSNYRADAGTNADGRPGTGAKNNGASSYSGWESGQTNGYGGVHTHPNNWKSGAGGGWNSNGGGGHTNCNYSVQPGYGAKSGSNAFKGGAGTTSSPSNTYPYAGAGGFGGGGGSTGRCGSCMSGAGGGYTGGGISSSGTNSYPTRTNLQGGGSYVGSGGSNISGTLQSTYAAHGYVKITLL